MNPRLDHVVVVVRSLAEAVSGFTAAGFTVSPGGRHDALPTENALVCFADGSYLELLATRDPATRDELAALRASDGWERHLRGVSAVARRFLPHLAGPDGVADWALRSEALATQAASARRLGLVASGPVAMRRTRADGEALEWRMLLPDSRLQPFWLADTTPRERRVPESPAATTHANGAHAIAAVQVRADPVPTAALELGDMLAMPPTLAADGTSVLAFPRWRVDVVAGSPAGACGVRVIGCGPLPAALAALGVVAEAPVGGPPGS